MHQAGHNKGCPRRTRCFGAAPMPSAPTTCCAAIGSTAGFCRPSEGHPQKALCRKCLCPFGPRRSRSSLPCGCQGQGDCLPQAPKSSKWLTKATASFGLEQPFPLTRAKKLPWTNSTPALAAFFQGLLKNQGPSLLPGSAKPPLAPLGLCLPKALSASPSPRSPPPRPLGQKHSTRQALGAIMVTIQKNIAHP